jgi:hypothetical protein
MSDSHHDEALHGNAAHNETEEKMVNGNVETHENHAHGGDDDSDIDDIENPARQSIKQIAATEETHNPITPLSPPSNTTTPVMDANNATSDRERRDSNVNDTTNNNDDESESESTNSTMESSPAPIKRAFVLSGREHEDTDDFLLSTMLAIRTAVCYYSFVPFTTSFSLKFLRV